MNRVRVLVVEDSVTVRKRIVEVLSADAQVEVVAEAEDGKTAIELCMRLRPDVLTLDMMMPVMSGLAATEYIMAYCPTPIVIVSSSTNRGELFRTYEALAAGAVDVLEKPAGDDSDVNWEARLIATVKLVSRIRVITHLRGRLGESGRDQGRPVHPGCDAAAGSAPAGRRAAWPEVVAIGASTGGPGAIVELVRALPRGFSFPILLVLHLGRLFAGAFADWLGSQCAFPVAYARDGDALPARGAPRVLLAPPDRHLVVRSGRLRLIDEPERHSCRPSVDVLFESIARELGPRAAACLLTGMGRDGAEGLLAIRQAGGCTFAQDEESSVVFGMPREAIALGAAERVLSPAQMARALSQLDRMAASGDAP